MAELVSFTSEDALPDFEGGGMPDAVPVFDDGPAMAAEARQAAADRLARRSRRPKLDSGLPGVPVADPLPPQLRTEMNPEGAAPREGMTFGENMRGAFFSGTETGVIAERAAIEAARGYSQPGGFQPSQLKNLPTYIRRRIEVESEEDAAKRREAAMDRVFEQVAFDNSKANLSFSSATGAVIGSLPSVLNIGALPEKAVAAIASRAAPVVGEVGGRIVAAGVNAGGTNAAADAVLQGARVAGGAQKEYDPVQTVVGGAIGFGAGAAIRGAIEIPSFVRTEAQQLGLTPEAIRPAQVVDAPETRVVRDTADDAARIGVEGSEPRVAGEAPAVARAEPAPREGAPVQDNGGVGRAVSAGEAPPSAGRIISEAVASEERPPLGRAPAANDDIEMQAAALRARPDSPAPPAASIATDAVDTPAGPQAIGGRAGKVTTANYPPNPERRFDRRTLIGEDTKARDLPEGIAPEAARDFRVNEAMQDLASRLGRKLELDNRFTLRGALGEYKPKDGVVRIRAAGDMEVFSHELGHAIDQTLRTGDAGADFKAMLKKHAGELRALDANTLDPTKKTVSEGVAEFLRMAINNPAYAAKQAPNFADDFDRLLSVKAPLVRDVINDAAMVSQIDSGLPPALRAQAQVVPAVEPKGMRKFFADAKRYGVWPTVGDVMDRFYANVTGFDHYGKVLLRNLQDARFKQTGAPMAEFGWENPYHKLRALPSAKQAAIDATQNGVRAYGKALDAPVSPSIYEALKEAGGGNIARMTDETSPEYRAFSSYVAMRAALGRYDRFLAGEVPKQPVAMSYREVQQAITDLEAASPQFRSAADKIFGFNRAIWNKLRDAGLIDTELHGAVAGRGEDYVPLNRWFDDKEGNSGGGGSDLQSSVVKSAKGSTRPILDPIQQTMLNAGQFERAIALNDIYRSYSKLAESGGPFAGRFIEKVPNTEMKAQSVDVMEAIRSSMRKSGADKADTEAILRTLENFVGEDATATIFRATDTNPRGENIFFTWEAGQRQAWKLANDDMTAGFFDMMTSMSNVERDLWKEVVGTTNAMFSQLITNAPQFAIKNLIMDAMSRMFIARNTGMMGRVPFAPLVQGIITHIGDKEFAKAYAAMGGIRGGVVSSALRELEQTGGLASIQVVPKGFTDTVRGYGEKAADPRQWSALVREAGSDAVKQYFHILESTETIGRIGQAKIVYNHLRKQGLDEYQAMHGAIFEARDVLDYDRRGRAMAGLVKFLPFMNPGVQGLARANRNLISDPLAAAVQAYQRGGLNALDGEMKTALKDAVLNWGMIAGGAVATLGYYYAVSDDEAYKRASPYMKKRYYLFPVGKEENGDVRYVSVPKPFDLPGAVFAAVEGVADSLKRTDGEGWSRFGKAMEEAFIPRQFTNLQDFLGSNPFLKTGFEVQTGTRLGFEGSPSMPIVPMNMKGVKPEDQFTGNTSEVAKHFGKLVGASPLVVDHVINGIGGTAGRDINDAITATIGNNPNMTPSDAFTKMFFGALYRRQRGVGAMRTDLAKDMEGDQSKVMAPALSYAMAITNGNSARAEELYNQADDTTKAFMTLRGYAFSPKDRQLHPLQRADTFTDIVGSLTRDLASNQVVIEDRSRKRGEEKEVIKLDRGAARSISNVLGSWAAEEIANGLTVAGRPGYQAMKVIDTRARLEAVKAISAEVGKEIDDRLEKAGVLPIEDVQRAWPDVKRRLIEDRENARLSDFLRGTGAKASRKGEKDRRRIQKERAEPGTE